jgi:arylsulfatase A-like enzyme
LTARTVAQPVKLSDVGPTILGLAGLPERLGNGQDLGPLLRGEALQARPIYLEATRGRRLHDTQDWNNLGNERGVVLKEQLFIRGPYGPDRAYALDPEQTVLVLDSRRMRALEKALESWDRGAPPHRPEDSNHPLRAALEALGYLDSQEQ